MHAFISKLHALELHGVHGHQIIVLDYNEESIYLKIKGIHNRLTYYIII